MSNENNFIGRNIYLSRIRQEIIHNDFSIGISVVGFPSMGKTETVLEALKDSPENINLVYLDLSKYDDPKAFWKDISKDISEYLADLDVEIPNLEHRIDQLKNLDLRWIDFQIIMNSLFNDLSKAGIKTVFILDEFDNASKLFESNPEYFDTLRSLILGRDLLISMIAISQKPIWMIEQAAKTSSTFYPMFDLIALRGFDQNDMYEYYEDLKEKGIDLSEDQKDRIRYYAGTIPYLLSIFRDLLVDNNSGENVDIEAIVSEKGDKIKEYYADLEEKLIDQGDLEKILTVLKEGESAIPQKDRDELIFLGYLTDRNGEYYSFSPYFVDYLKEKYNF